MKSYVLCSSYEIWVFLELFITFLAIAEKHKSSLSLYVQKLKENVSMVGLCSL